MPTIDFYDIDTKKDVKKRNEFKAWHKKLVEQNYVFDFQKGMYKYCSQDVTILRLCWVDIRRKFLSETGVDPFCYCTIAAAVMAVYGSKYLKKKRIGIIPKNLYYVDGFCEETRTVYEFYGCVYHGCALCFDGTNDHPYRSERKMCDVYEATIEREERLRAFEI